MAEKVLVKKEKPANIDQGEGEAVSGQCQQLVHFKHVLLFHVWNLW